VIGLPPGTLLQLMYLRERIGMDGPRRFIEVGPGAGEVTRLMLNHGWSGYSYDLDAKTIDMLRDRFNKEVRAGELLPVHDNFLTAPPPAEKVDVIISCMVMEHMDGDGQVSFMQKAAQCLSDNGKMIAVVPASPKDWGIEDEIAGHFRRYTSGMVRDIADLCGWRILHIAGLTFPLSNLLLPVSNYLVNREERHKLALSALERTKQSGRRSVRYKTHFPRVLGLLLNEYPMYPFHMLQKAFCNSERALVLYFEAQPLAKTGH
jgi:SAM-dependent methyltransferase